MADAGNDLSGAGPILVVDDDPEIREVLKLALEVWGHRVMTAVNGREALEALRRTRPSLIFLDLMMPVMSGAECLAAIRADPELKELPVVIVSAWPVDPEMSSRVQGMVTKPAEIKSLLSAIEEHARAPAAGQPNA